MEVINYFKDRDTDKAIEIAELGMKKCKDDQTEIIIFLIQCARGKGDRDKETRLLKSAKARRAVELPRVLAAIGEK